MFKTSSDPALASVLGVLLLAGALSFTLAALVGLARTAGNTPACACAGP